MSVRNYPGTETPVAATPRRVPPSVYLVLLGPLAALDGLGELRTHSWNNALVGAEPDHGVAFPRAGLPVGQEGGIVALPGTVQKSSPDVLEEQLWKEDAKQVSCHQA